MIIRDEVRATPAYVFQDDACEVKLDQNEAPEDLPISLRERVEERLRATEWHRYPELRAMRAAQAIAERDGWDADGVLLGPGSNVLIQAAVIAAGLQRSVLTVSPTFAVYGQQARILGADLEEVPLVSSSFALDVEQLESKLERSTGVFFLTDPAAPTGNRHDDDQVQVLLQTASRNGWLTVIDEAYWAYDGRHRLDDVRGHEDRISLRTFSKADALGGVRLGYMLGHPDTIREIGKVLLPFNVSGMQSVIAEFAASDAEALSLRDARIASTLSERERVYRALDAMPNVRIHPSSTNFLLFSVPDATLVHQRLLTKGIRIRRQDHLPQLAGHLRVSIGGPSDNQRFLDAMASIFDQEAS